MSYLGCCRDEDLPPRLSDRQRIARLTVGLMSLAVAARVRRRAGTLGAVSAAGAGWFGISHVVAAKTRYSGCPELGAISSLLLHRDVHVGCVPWRNADRWLGLAR